MATPLRILINSSKTMIARTREDIPLRVPVFDTQAHQLDAFLKLLSLADLRRVMHISPKLALTTHALIARWGAPSEPFGTALDTFSGDIYRGLKAETFTRADREYADNVLCILSGLYGIVRPFDAIQPYRLEMMYRISPKGYKNLYDFWGSQIADTLREVPYIVNLASEEYFKVVGPYIDANRIVSPQFLTLHPKTAVPTFVAIHAKVARGSFARWLITTKRQTSEDFAAFSELGYIYDQRVSTPQAPTFIRPM